MKILMKIKIIITCKAFKKVPDSVSSQEMLTVIISFFLRTM